MLTSAAAGHGSRTEMSRRKLFLGLAAVVLSGHLFAALRSPSLRKLAPLGRELWRRSLDGGVDRGARAAQLHRGRTLEYVRRSCGEQLDRLPGLAAELGALKVDVIVAVGHEAQSAARQATRTMPIVMPGAGDPVGDGFIASFAYPGGKMTGLAVSASEIEVKQLEILIEPLPSTMRIATSSSSHSAHARSSSSRWRASMPLHEAAVFNCKR